MPQHTSRPQFIHISLRELLLLVAFIAIGCAALKTAGNVWWTILSAFTLLIFTWFALVAVVDRGARQSFALGFVTCVIIYGALLASQRRVAGEFIMNPELDPYEGKLPTTKLLLPLYQAVVSEKWVDPETLKEIPNFDPAKDSPNYPMGGGGGGFFGGPHLSESPDRRVFTSIAHVLWSLLLGYTGGHVARVIYLRRVSGDRVEKHDIASPHGGIS